MRAARERAKKTQQQVADELDVTKGAVSQWENDQTVPELEYFVAFCIFTDASADEILLHRDMDPLLSQLIQIWKRLSLDGRDSLLGNANRILAREHPEAGPHNPFPHTPRPALNTSKSARKPRQS
jgi:transcriptional regulator with XRE-family HTH domain